MKTTALITLALLASASAMRGRDGERENHGQRESGEEGRHGGEGRGKGHNGPAHNDGSRAVVKMCHDGGLISLCLTAEEHGCDFIENMDVAM